MKELIHSTNAYRGIRFDAERMSAAHSMLVLFPDEKYLRMLLKECAKAFFGARNGSREALLIEKESYADCVFFPAEGAKYTVEDGAKIIEGSLMRPVEGERKLFVLDGFHGASARIQNKLLKSFEEPPSGVFFLLGSASEYALLPTVRSRMKTYAVSPFSEEEIKGALERNYGEGQIAESAAACGGIYSLAESLLKGDEFALAEEFLRAENISVFCRKMDSFAEKGAFFSALSLLLRDIAFAAQGMEKYASSKRYAAFLGEFPQGAALAALDYIREAEKELQFNTSFGQCLFALAARISKEKEKWKRLS